VSRFCLCLTIDEHISLISIKPLVHLNAPRIVERDSKRLRLAAPHPTTFTGLRQDPRPCTEMGGRKSEQVTRH